MLIVIEDSEKDNSGNYGLSVLMLPQESTVYHIAGL
jgi:hypothetical protein